MKNTVLSLAFNLSLILSIFAFPSCAESQESKSITYDQIVDPKESRDLGTQTTVLDSYRVSSTEEIFYCENHTLTYKFSENFENRVRSNQGIEILFDGKKVESEIIRQKSKSFDQYKFYDVKYRCIDGTAGLMVYGYKPGLNGAVSSGKVFSIYFKLSTGNIYE